MGDPLIAIIGCVVLVLGLLSGFVKQRLWVSEPLFALLIGVLFGPRVLAVVDPLAWDRQHELVELVARLTLAIGLMGVALRLSLKEMWQHRQGLITLLLVVMPVMAAVSGAIVWGLFDMSMWMAVVVGAVVAPTDPVVASAIVRGKTARGYMPASVRNLLSSESGLNDGLALPMLLLPLAMLESASAGRLGKWALHGVLLEVGGGLVIGGVMGALAGWALNVVERHHWIETTSLLGVSVALSMAVLGVAGLAHTDGLLAVFVAGLAFDRVVGNEDRKREEQVQEAVNRFFTLPIFLLLGAALPWAAWGGFGWRGVVLVLGVLALRRLPMVLALKRLLPPVKRWREAVWLGWFGPIGVAAVFYAAFAARKTGDERVWGLATLLIAASIAAHGITATPLTRWLGEKQAEDDGQGKKKEQATGESLDEGQPVVGP